MGGGQGVESDMGHLGVACDGEIEIGELQSRLRQPGQLYCDHVNNILIIVNWKI